MATFVNDLRLTEIATGDEAGDWGDITNTNLELVAEAFSFGTEAITTNANTHTTTIADGGTDPGRSIFLKYTGTLDSACTITIGPNTVSKLWFIENGTSGSQNIIISSGSGANITIPPGDTKVVYSDGAGSGAAMVDAFASLSVVDLKVQDDLTVTDDLTVNGTANLDIVDIDGAVQLDATLTVGANDQGYDVILYGDTAARNITWDSSDDSLEFADNTKAVFGSGEDAQIYFDATDFKVGATAGHLDLFASATGSSVRILGSGETLAEFTDDGDVDLFHNGSVKLSTTATGISVSGTVATTEIDSGGDLTVDAVGALRLKGSPVFIMGSGNSSTLASFSQGGAAVLNYNNSGKISTTNTGVEVVGGVTVKNGATSAGFVEFFEDSDNGTNKVTLIGPASTADVTLTLPASAGTIATTASAADDATALAIALG